jgi:hypothetical protein
LAGTSRDQRSLFCFLNKVKLVFFNLLCCVLFCFFEIGKKKNFLHDLLNYATLVSQLRCKVHKTFKRKQSREEFFSSSTLSDRGCQMAYIQTQNLNLGKFAMVDLGLIYAILCIFGDTVYFVAIWYI